MIDLTELLLSLELFNKALQELATAHSDFTRQLYGLVGKEEDREEDSNE